MSTNSKWWARVAHLLNTHLVIALGACYALAAFFPAAGVALRDLRLGSLPGVHGSLPISAPMALLSLLLINSALTASTSDLRVTFKNPLLLFAGVGLNSLVPVTF